jgi:hypothetical protein
MVRNTVLWNGNILALDAAGRKFQALAVVNGRIARIGSNRDILDLVKEDWESLDLQGRTVLPGFIDTHEHLMQTGLAAIGIDLARVKTIDEILQKVEDRIKETPEGDWILGYCLNDLDIEERRMPTRHDLDRVCTTHPVQLMHATLHLCSFNTKALEVLNLPGNVDGIDRVSGEPTGVIRDPAILTVVHPAMARLIHEETKQGALHLACQMALEKGITTLHALDGGFLGPGDVEVILKCKDELPVRVVLYHQSMDVEKTVRLGLPRIGGCLCADGAFEAHTAALFEPYADEPENYGALTYTQGEMRGFILKAHEAGLQIAIHCEADRSIEQVLSGYEKALRVSPRKDHRHRIEHFELPTENQIERAARAGIMLGMQPAFLPAFVGMNMEKYEALLGTVRLRSIHPYRTILDHGIVIGGGSDSPVTPYNPLAGVEAAVNHPNPDQRVSVKEGFEMFTMGAARIAFEENEKGSIEPGKWADLVVLAEDPFAVAPDRIGEILIEMTMVEGMILFRRENEWDCPSTQD